MSQRPQLVLDGASIDSESDLHQALADLLGFFEGYGHNLDALWDVLADDDLRAVKGPVDVMWKDAARFATRDPERFIQVQRVFAEAREPVSLVIAF